MLTSLAGYIVYSHVADTAFSRVGCACVKFWLTRHGACAREQVLALASSWAAQQRSGTLLFSAGSRALTLFPGRPLAQHPPHPLGENEASEPAFRILLCRNRHPARERQGGGERGGGRRGEGRAMRGQNHEP